MSENNTKTKIIFLAETYFLNDKNNDQICDKKKKYIYILIHIGIWNKIVFLMWFYTYR